jgi:hypothetical protein
MVQSGDCVNPRLADKRLESRANEAWRACFRSGNRANPVEKV